MKTRIEITGKDKFWENALQVEWQHQYPERVLEFDPAGYCLIDPAWLEDFVRVGEQCFCRITRAPDNPARRQLFSVLLPWRRDD